MLKHVYGLAADEQTEDVRAAAGEVLKKFDRRYYRASVRKGEHAREMYGALGESGLLGIGIPEEHGGQGGGMVEQAALFETFAAAGIPLAQFVLPNFTRQIVLKFGTDEQIQDFIPATLTGTANYCFALTEADSGTNMFAMQTKAVRDGDDYLISGSKMWISQVNMASKMLVVARTSPLNPDARTEGLSIFAVDLPADGLSIMKMAVDHGDGDDQFVVNFDEVRVPAASRIGDEGAGAKLVFHGLNPERIIASTMSLGIGFHLIERAADYAKERAPFGKATGTYQAVQHPLAKSFIEMRAARSLVYEAAAFIDAGRDAGVITNAAKYLATESAFRAHDAAMQTFGGAAFDNDTDILPFYNNLRLFRVAPLNNESVLNQIAERVLGMPASS